MSYKNPVMSSDPKAVEKLQAELDAATKLQERMKKANEILKKHGGSEESVKQLTELGFSERGIHAMMNPTYSYEKMGFQAWQLSNNNANMRRIKERIEALSPVPA